MSCNPLLTQLEDTALRLAAWWGAATQRYGVWSRNTPLAGGKRRAQLKLLSLVLLRLLLRERKGERAGEKLTGRERERCGGGSLYRILNYMDSTEGLCNNCQENVSSTESNGSLCCCRRDFQSLHCREEKNQSMICEIYYSVVKKNNIV